MRLVYHLEGLDCAHCAAKIERAAANMEAVREAVVDFPRPHLRETGTEDRGSRRLFRRSWRL